MSKTPRPVARLALEDGTVFTGRGFGACRHAASSTGEEPYTLAILIHRLRNRAYKNEAGTMTRIKTRFTF